MVCRLKHVKENKIIMRRKNGRYKKDNQIKLLEINNDISEMKRGLTTN